MYNKEKTAAVAQLTNYRVLFLAPPGVVFTLQQMVCRNINIMKVTQPS